MCFFVRTVGGSWLTNSGRTPGELRQRTTAHPKNAREQSANSRTPGEVEPRTNPENRRRSGTVAKYRRNGRFWAFWRVLARRVDNVPTEPQKRVKTPVLRVTHVGGCAHTPERPRVEAAGCPWNWPIFVRFLIKQITTIKPILTIFYYFACFYKINCVPLR